VAGHCGSRGDPGSQPSLDVKDEYDLQDLLRSVLRLHFDDVRAEEWNPSYGGVQSRSDLVLKQERIVIETKMTRKSLTQAELVRQLIQDKELYRDHPNCGTLVFFVYDPGRRLTNPAAIEHDLSDVRGRPPAVVVVSPRGL
jgi:REase_DpnII-MboI